MQKVSATTRDVLRVFWNHSKKYPASLWLGFFFAVAASVFDIIVPLYYKNFFDALGINAPEKRLVEILVLIMLLGFARWVSNRIGAFLNNFFQSRVMADLRQSSFRYLVGHSYSFFADNFGGSLVQGVNRLARAFESFTDKIIFDLMPLLVSVVGIMIILVMLNPAIAIAMAVWISIFTAINIWFAKWRLPMNVERAKVESDSTGVLSDAITNHSNIQMFSALKEERRRYEGITNDLFRITKKTWDQQEILSAIQGFLFITIQFLLFYYLVTQFSRNNAAVTIGLFVLLQNYISQLIDRLWNLGRIIRGVYESFADAKEMVDILQTPYDIKDARGASDLQVKRGKIELKNVSFSFHKTRKVLDKLSLLVRPGERVALVGHSGAGKSTLIKLLFRLYDTDEGKILIDGQDIKKVTQESLRNAIGMVPQDPILFHRTLMDNIRYGRRDATDQEVVEAAKKAHCHEFIDALPEKYNTFVGERGIKLSGGERQRVAIARAFLKNAPILVLDEATSSLDSEVELLIQESLRELMRDKTVLVIAHRLSTIRQMDRIIVLEGGKVIDQGTHEDLLESQGLYASLWKLQSGGFISMKETE